MKNKVSVDVAEMLTRLKAVTERKKPNKYESRNVLRKSRTTLARRLQSLATSKLEKKIKFLESCRYLSCATDEADTFSGSAPLSASLQGCSKDFGWFNSFMGQGCVGDDRSGAGCHRRLKQVVPRSLWPRICFLVTDGASAMRSTHKYAGLDGNPEGTSLHACMMRDPELGDNLPSLHCLTHQLNLALKHALSANSFWSDTWLQHVRVVFNWFSRSPGRKAALRKVHRDMLMVRQTVTWKLTYPKYYAPTRWLGIRRALVSILNSRELLVAYTEELRTSQCRLSPRSTSLQW